MDVVELNLLSGLQDKRGRLARMAAQQAAGIQSIAGRIGQMVTAATPSTNGMTPASEAADTSAIGSAPGALVNRSPVTNNHYYPTTQEPTPKAINPWPWIAAIIAILALTAGVWWYSQRPVQAPQKIGGYGLGLDDLKVY